MMRPADGDDPADDTRRRCARRGGSPCCGAAAHARPSGPRRRRASRCRRSSRPGRYAVRRPLAPPRAGRRARARSRVRVPLGVAAEDLLQRGRDGSLGGRSWSSTASIGSTSFVELVMKTSSAVVSTSSGSGCSRTSTPAARPHSMTSPRVMPGSRPESAGGVSTTPSTTTKTLLPVHSHSSPRVLAKTASMAPDLLGAGERDDVLGIRRRLEPDDRGALVARPRHDREAPARRRARLGRREHDGRQRRVVRGRSRAVRRRR